MSFRFGEGGAEMWARCLEAKVAAMTYSPLKETDLSKFPQEEPANLWKRLPSSARYSLRMVAYEMEPGDVIYVKQGENIVGRGTVTGKYRFDRKRLVVDDDGGAWRHQVPVAWDAEFAPIKIQVGDQQRYIVRPLSDKDVELLEKYILKEPETRSTTEAMEGQRLQRLVNFIRRNRALIAAKKANSDGLCEACGFSFSDFYGSIGDEYIVAHHDDPLGQRDGPSPITLDSISLVCPNCHAMLHTSPSPSVSQLRRIVQRQAKKNGRRVN